MVGRAMEHRAMEQRLQRPEGQPGFTPTPQG
jgi:hypothetical protein